MSRHLPSTLRHAAWVIALGLALVMALHDGPRAQPNEGHRPDEAHGDRPEEADAFQDMVQPGFRVMPLHDAAQIALGRFRGRLIAARLKPPTPEERARGVELVHELKLMTQTRDVLRVRLDARTGAFLEVAGTGLTEARRKNGDSE